LTVFKPIVFCCILLWGSAMQLFDSAGIAWAENIPEHEFINLDSLDV